MIKDAPKISFSKRNLLLGIMTYNRPLYISTNFIKYQVSRMLVDLNALVSIMTLIMPMFLRINKSLLKVDKMVLKKFNEFINNAMGTIALAFEIDG